MGTWIVGAIVALIIGLAARKVYNDHKTSKCGGGCANCGQAGNGLNCEK